MRVLLCVSPSSSPIEREMASISRPWRVAAAETSLIIVETCSMD